MDVLSTLSSYFYWGESDSQDGTLTPPTEAEVEERLGGAEEEDEWILVGKKGRNVRRKNSKEEEEDEDVLPFPWGDYDAYNPTKKDAPKTEEIPALEESESEDDEEEETVKYEYESYRDAMLRRPKAQTPCTGSKLSTPAAAAPVTPTLTDKQMGCKPQLACRPPMRQLKRQQLTASRKNERKSLKRTNQLKTRDVAAKRVKQVGRMHGKQGGMGGKRTGWH